MPGRCQVCTILFCAFEPNKTCGVAMPKACCEARRRRDNGTLARQGMALRRQGCVANRACHQKKGGPPCEPPLPSPASPAAPVPAGRARGCGRRTRSRFVQLDDVGLLTRLRAAPPPASHAAGATPSGIGHRSASRRSRARPRHNGYSLERSTMSVMGPRERSPLSTMWA